MVRIKFTGPPPATAHSQLSRARSDLPTEVTTPATAGTQNTLNGDLVSSADHSRREKQQSLEMVKIMLHVTFGTLFYLREFLPLPCFDDRDLKEAQRQKKFSYREFIDSNTNPSLSKGSPNVASGQGKRGQPLKVILRGSDPKADMIVDVLETGIFDALSKSVLEAIQLTIVADKAEPDNVLESYTFTFKYTGGAGQLNSRLESLSIEPVGYVADIKSAQTARMGLESIVRRLITLSAFLPTLPNKRALGIHLFYTEDCPPEYEPPGFAGARDGTINYPLTENWQKESQACGTMDSGWHTVGLKVTSLKWVGPEPESIPQIPAQIEYKDTVPRIADIGFEDEGSNLISPQPRATQEATQDAIERERLKQMMPSQELPLSEPDSDVVATQPAKSIQPSEPEKTETPAVKEKPRLSEAKIAEIRRRLASQSAEDVQIPGTVQCECDWDEEEKPMLECNFCRTRQHPLCYGYDDATGFSVPDIHACYKCLLGPDEARIFDRVKEIMVARRALRIILDDGYPVKTSTLTEKLHSSGDRITSILAKEGFLESTPGSKVKGFGNSGLPRFRIPLSENIHERIRTEIMDPRVKIRHHFAGQNADNALVIRSPPASSEVDGASKLASQSQSQAKATPGSAKAETPAETPQQHPHNLRRKSMRSNPLSVTDSEIADRRDVVPATPQSSQLDTPRSTRKRTRSSQVGPEPVSVTPSQSTPGQDEEGLRRSGRKRRKISNYNKLIDVGALSSGDEKA
ncbi:HORMA domain-containing protein [Aspergillus pseudodeflectus]|uniref:HORMA domain-containing protein n=1 Tax=Aspergillus pseudodeflectus TaxID=176178 RepID=A0ABR4JP35_9EURO